MRQEKGIKGTQIRQEDVKQFLFIYDMVSCIENSKEHRHTQTIRDLLMRSTRLQNTNCNIQKPIVFLYTSNEQSEYNIKKIAQFIITKE